MSTSNYLRIGFSICFLLITLLSNSQIDYFLPAKKQDSTKPKEHMLRCEKRTIPGEQFSRADLVRSQRELANLNYFDTKVETKTIISDNIVCVLHGTLVKKTPKPMGSDPLDEDIDLKKNISSACEEEMKVPNCRETNGINRASEAEAYPFLSGDGLRLYFTSSREGVFGRLFISTRNSVNDPFGKPEILSKYLTEGYWGASLTGDELTLCMVKSGRLFISIRSGRNQEFPEPVQVTGASDNDHYGPSISFDGKEIVATVEIEGKNRIRIYKRTGDYIVQKTNDLSLPKGLEADAGQLSKDGLSYYFSIETKKNEHLWRFTRHSTADNFGDLTELPEPMKGLKNIIQPSLNSDGSIMVFVTANKDLWNYDDILLVNTGKKHFDLPKMTDSLFVIAGNTLKTINKISSPQLIEYVIVPKEEIVTDEESTDIDAMSIEPVNSTNTRKIATKVLMLQSSVYPNPFTSNIIITISELPANGALLNICDLTGKSIRQQKLSSLTTNVSLAGLSAGVYTYQVIDQKSNLVSTGKLIKSQ